MMSCDGKLHKGLCADSQQIFKILHYEAIIFLFFLIFWIYFGYSVKIWLHLDKSLSVLSRISEKIHVFITEKVLWNIKWSHKIKIK